MTKHGSNGGGQRTPRGGFTLIEMMVVIAILLVIILATSKIFGSASKVATQGQANADVLQEAAAIERQIRHDLQRLAPEGFITIVSHRVLNSINVNAGGPLLDPVRPATDFLRADQLMFFSNGAHSLQTYRDAQFVFGNRKPQSNVARIYYGPAFQLLRAQAGYDLVINPAQKFFPPWFFETGTGTQIIHQNGANDNINGAQPGALQIILARQAILLADDGGSEGSFLNQGSSAQTPRDASVRNSRVDAAAYQLNDIRNDVTQFNFLPWIDQRNIMLDEYMFFPRAERVAPSMNRLDHALTTPTLGSACSEFIVEWTYDDQTWFNNGLGGNDDSGFIPIYTDRQKPWFGMPDDGHPLTFPRGTDFLSTWLNLYTSFTSPSTEIEFYDDSLDGGDRHYYSATFGYDKNLTPWPSALRITMRLHDVKGRLEHGRIVQFVVDLPRN